jgi:hypothetical protein
VTSTGAPGTAGKERQAREIIELLLRHGADPGIKNRQGKTPADYVRDEAIRSLLAGRSHNARPTKKKRRVAKAQRR